MLKLFYLITATIFAGVASAQTGSAPAKPVTLDSRTVAPAASNDIAHQSAVTDCGCESNPLPEVVAVVNGIKITKQDFSPELQKRVTQLQSEVIEARRRELELQINSMLLEAEAKRLNVSPTKLLENEIVAKTADPTEAEAQTFYNENKGRIQREFPEVKGDIVAYLRENRQRELAGKVAERLRVAATVQLLVKEATPPASAADRSRVFAIVNGRRITSGDIEDSLAPLISGVQRRVYETRKQDLDMKINDLLLFAEAQKQHVTTRALLDKEVDTKVTPVTESQTQAFYNENKARITGEFAAVKDDIAQYLREAEVIRQHQAFADRLRQGATLQTFLDPPAPLEVKIAIDNQPTKGNANAAVTIVEFIDYQCQACAETPSMLEKLLAEYGDRVRLVVRDFPLKQHPNANQAAEAAEAARAQGKYWEYTALLFANQSALDKDRLKEYASRVGLDRSKFDAALDGGTFAEEVRRDVFDGGRAGVVGTPTFFVNGRQVGEPSYVALKTAIDAALKAAPTR
jgi:protein-disulfide isomerase